jgi:hypothetical protein
MGRGRGLRAPAFEARDLELGQALAAEVEEVLERLSAPR